MILLKKTDVITPEQDKTNIFINFNVPDGIKKLIINYSYSPKTVNGKTAIKLIEEKIKQYGAEGSTADYLPVKNLITLSLNDANGYRGAAHRQAEIQHHEISESYADAGFLKGKINSGIWQIALNIHCCACSTSYSIEIKGAEK